jgi:hypothetical protein
VILGKFQNNNFNYEGATLSRQQTKQIYETFIQSRFAQVAVEQHQLKLIVYYPVSEEIV